MSGAEPAVHLREAHPSDVEALARLMAGAPLMHRYGVGVDRAREVLLGALTAGDYLVLAAEAGDRPVGLARATVLPGLGRPAYLHLLLVGSEHTGRRVGARLLATVEAWAARRARHLLLLTSADNHAARRFYERNGYRLVGTLERLVLPDADEVMYQKRLDGEIGQEPVADRHPGPRGARP